jgi:hypothetical protein
MTNRKRYLKLVAFVPAIVLVGGFVGYRAGAFELFSKPEPQPEPQPVAEQPPPAPEGKPTYLSGSKFMHIDLQPPNGTTPTNPPTPGAAPPNSPLAKPPTFMLGSKSAPISGVVEGLTPGEPSKAKPSAPPGVPTAPNPPQP